jgi:hypothetical protein
MKTLRRLALSLLFLSTISTALIAQNIYLDWAVANGGIGFDIGRAAAMDAQGLSYSAGFFQATVDFDPSAGVTQYVSNGDNDAYLQKHDHDGNLLWAKAFGGTGTDEAKGIAVDALGNVYITGRFTGTVDFDPGAAVITATATGMTDVFVVKFDPNGNYLWHRRIGTAGSDEGTAIVVDGSGVYTVGYFQGAIDLDPTVGFDPATSVAGTLDIFVQHLGPNGNYLWGKAIGSDGTDYGFGITTSPNGNILATGCFQNTVDFDPGTGTQNLSMTSGATGGFVLALSASGNYAWAKPMTTTGSCIGYAITTSPSGAVYVTGGFSGTVDFDPGIGTDLHTSNAFDAYYLKFDASGNYQYAASFGGLGDDYGYAIDVAGDNAVYFTGGYGATVDFDASAAGTYNMTSFNNTFDSYIERIDTLGNFVWARSLGGGGIDYGFGLAADNLGHVLTTGCFDQTVDFDTEAGTYNLTTNGNAEIYVHKLKQCSPSAGADTLSGCDSLVINGQVFTQSGNYTQNLTNITSCDSTLSLTLAIAHSSSQTITQSACDSLTLNGITYSTSGTYVQTLTNAQGCDSTLTLQLTINVTNDTIYQMGNALVANAYQQGYQWVDCNNGFAPIPGAIDSFLILAASGNYAVIVNMGLCYDTSACYTFVGIDNGFAAGVQLYPNPNKGQFTLEWGNVASEVTITLFDMLGKKIWQRQANGTRTDIQFEAPTGMYIVEFRSSEGIARMKMRKE